jgi:hypothetical protein
MTIIDENCTKFDVAARCGKIFSFIHLMPPQEENSGCLAFGTGRKWRQL